MGNPAGYMAIAQDGPTILSLYTSFCFLKASRFSRVANSQTVKLGLCSLSILVSQSSAVLLRFYCKFDLLSAELVDCSVLLPSIPITKVVHNKASYHYRVGQNLVKVLTQLNGLVIFI